MLLFSATLFAAESDNGDVTDFDFRCCSPEKNISLQILTVYEQMRKLEIRIKQLADSNRSEITNVHVEQIEVLNNIKDDLNETLNNNSIITRKLILEAVDRSNQILMWILGVLIYILLMVFLGWHFCRKKNENILNAQKKFLADRITSSGKDKKDTYDSCNEAVENLSSDSIDNRNKIFVPDEVHKKSCGTDLENITCSSNEYESDFFSKNPKSYYESFFEHASIDSTVGIDESQYIKDLIKTQEKNFKSMMRQDISRDLKVPFRSHRR